MDLTKISEFDGSSMPMFPPNLNVDLDTLIHIMEQMHWKTREQLPKGPIFQMRSETKRLKSLLALEPTSTWSPKELASAGFYCTGLENSSQCYFCGLVLCRQSLNKAPMDNHRKFNPNCGFIQGQEVGNISKYDVRVQPLEGIVKNDGTMENEEARLASFKLWPVYALIKANVLAEAGFFFKGTRDTVQCFSCAGCLGNWEENDDPWREHAKWFPECAFLCSKKSKEEIEQYIQDYSGFADVTATSFLSILDERKLSPTAENTYEQIQHFEDINTLRNQLFKSYNDPEFYNVSSMGDATPRIDLKSFFADISVVLKDTNNQALQNLTLPDILSDLSDITMIEGAAGSGKTALLKKIAILWASGCCSILNRFSLVFFVSVSSIESQHSLADIISKQLLGATVSVSQNTLVNILHQLKNRVLFLLDDYCVMDSVPEAIEELYLKNHLNRLSLAIAVRTGKARKLRQYARTILSILEFPCYSTIYLIKKLFPHDPERIKQFFLELETSKNLQTTLKIPLVTLALCSYWAQYPGKGIVNDAHVFKTYLLYNMNKFCSYAERVKTVVSSCGELALKGLFQSKFAFTENELSEVGVVSDEALKFGLLSKFTAQKLYPTYKFFHSSFQEFLAGKRLSELLESDIQEELDTGLHYLQSVNTFLKINGHYNYFLKYASRNSSKATRSILSYLFSLIDRKEALDCHSESKGHLERHPELELQEKITIFTLSQNKIELCNSFLIKLLVTFAVEAAVECECLSDCAPLIMNFLAGKAISFSEGPIFNTSNDSLLFFMEKYPEAIALVRCVEFRINGNKPGIQPDFLAVTNKFKDMETPNVEKDYLFSYPFIDEKIKENQEKLNESNEIYSFIHQKTNISDSVVRIFGSLGSYKAPAFKLEVNNVDVFVPNNCEKLKVLFAVSGHIELLLSNSEGFIQSIRPAIEQNLDSFNRCIIKHTDLSAEEQELLLKMASLEHLEIQSSQDTKLDFLISGLHRFAQLNHLSINLLKYSSVMDQLQDEFGSLNKMKKLVFLNCDFQYGSTRFAQFIQNFGNLEVLQLNFQSFPDFQGLITSITNCKKLKELHLLGPNLQDIELFLLASALENFKSLKVLDLSNFKTTAQDTAKNMVLAMRSLFNLEKLLLPTGEGMAQAAKLFIRELPNLPNLQYLSMVKILDDESIVELGRAVNNGYLKKLCHLQLWFNANVTESGWKSFFDSADCLPELNFLDISRMYTYQIKTHPTTVTSFVRFVSRLPKLVNVCICGWLLDEDDRKVFNTMKEQHPQSKSLNLIWQFYLPFLPNIED